MPNVTFADLGSLTFAEADWAWNDWPAPVSGASYPQAHMLKPTIDAHLLTSAGGAYIEVPSAGGVND